MKAKDLLTHTQKSLAEAGITTARLDSLLLLEDITGKDRAWLLAHPDYDVKGPTLQELNRQIERRAKHEPLAYIRSKSEFYGRGFAVNTHTLQPRPETETMIDLLKQVVISRQSSVASQKKETQEIPTRSHGSTTSDKRQVTSDNDLTVIDVGTGSGCIAITTKSLYPEAHVIAIDIDDKCLKLARQNAKTHNTDITFLKGNLLEPLINPRAGSTYVEPETDLLLSSGVNRINHTMHEPRKEKSGSGPQANNSVVSSADKQAFGDTWILLANLPYVPDSHTINKAATHEPKHAIFGGSDGLDYYRELFQQTKNLAHLPSFIFTEALPPQHETLSAIAEKHGYIQINQSDFIQIFVPKTDNKTL